MIILENERKNVLLEAGATQSFLDAVDNLEMMGEIQYQIQKPDGAYFYLPTIENEYDILSGYDIVPICDGPNGDSFYVLLKNKDNFKYVYFELEADEIYNDFGSSFQLFLAHLIIDYLGFSQDKTPHEIAVFANNLGLVKSKEIVDEVEKLDNNVDMEEWEKDVLPSIMDITLNNRVN